MNTNLYFETPPNVDSLSASQKFWIGSKQSVNLFLKLHVPLLILSCGKALLTDLLAMVRFKITSFQINVLWCPVLEELLFRGLIQEAVKKAALVGIQRFHPHANAAETAYQVSRAATSILFAAVHLAAGSPFQALNAGLGAFFGEAELMEKVGLTAAIGCHMTHNALCWSLLKIVS